MATPIQTVDALVRGINAGDLNSAVAAYAADAILVAQPGVIARGTSQIREALAGFIAMKAQLRSEAHQVIENQDVALYIGRWSLDGTDPSGQPIKMSGESTDVLRRQSDGRWLVAVDNPWGAQILPPR